MALTPGNTPGYPRPVLTVKVSTINLLHNKSEAATRYAASNFISALDYCPPVHDTTTISNITTWILTSALVLINNIV